MNEFIDSASLARLTGTFGQPDGLLTSAVRRNRIACCFSMEIERRTLLFSICSCKSWAKAG